MGNGAAGWWDGVEALSGTWAGAGILIGEEKTMTKRNRALPAIALALALALALIAGACSDGGDDDGIDSGTASTDSTAGDGSTTETTSPDGSTSTSSSTTSTTDSSGSTPAGLPGEPWEGFAKAGDELSVFGVASDDVLNVRSIPGTGGQIVATADPTDNDLVATGEARQLSRSFWYEVTVDGVTGWVSVAFVAYEGGTDDATAEYLQDNDRPGAETMEDLGLLVAGAFASEDPDSDIVQSVAPTVGDLGEVTYDVVGLGDDAAVGYRIHVFAEENDSGEGFDLRTIERTTFCGRGLAGELCV